MNFVACPHCKMQVIPKLDGTCPSCQKRIAKATVQLADRGEISGKLPERLSEAEASFRVPEVTARPRASRSTLQPVKLKAGGILLEAAGIAWQHRVLWLSFLAEYIFTALALLWLWFDLRLVLWAWLLVAVVLAFIGAAICSRGTLSLQRGETHLELGRLIRESLPYFWRLAATSLLTALIAILVSIPFIFLLAFAFVAISGPNATGTPLSIFGAIFGIPLQILFTAYVQLCCMACLVEDRGVFDAIRRGWQVFGTNLTASSGMAIWLFLCLLPVYAPSLLFRFLPSAMALGFLAKALRPLNLGLIALAVCVSLVLAAWLTVFQQAAWTLTYLRLTHHRPAKKAHA